LLWPKAATLKSVDHTYKELGIHNGFVEVKTNGGKICRRNFSVIITDLD